MTEDHPLTEGARLTLPHVDGRPWFEILNDVPRNRRGHQRSFHQTFRPLIAAELVIEVEQPARPDGTRPYRRYYRTVAGHRMLEKINGAG